MATVKPYKFVWEDVDRHGNVRLDFCRPDQPEIRLRSPSGSAEFAEYQAALNAEKTPGAIGPTRAKPATWRWLCEQYFASVEFRQLEHSTRRVRRQLLEHTFFEPRKPGAPELFADCPLPYLTTKAICVLRDRQGDLLVAANNRVKAISRVFTLALAQKPPLVSPNPARDVTKPQRASQGHHTWTVAEVERFEAIESEGFQGGSLVGCDLQVSYRFVLGVLAHDAFRSGRGRRAPRHTLPRRDRGFRVPRGAPRRTGGDAPRNLEPDCDRRPVSRERRVDTAAIAGGTPEGLQALLDAVGLIPAPREPEDDPVIVECWL